MSSLLANIITIAILLAVVSAACLHIYRSKKKGCHCIGCPMGGQCHKKNAGVTGQRADQLHASTNREGA